MIGTTGSDARHLEEDDRWLVVGHGSVGSALVRRIERAGMRPVVYDPSPRVAVVSAEHLRSLEGEQRIFERVISCVEPSAAVRAIHEARSILGPSSLYLDWNTLAPATKRMVASDSPCPVVDVALLDTLDEESLRPSLAVSGPAADLAAGDLTRLGFHVDVVGPECGDAALLKFARSLFMKTLEALVVEFEAAIADLPGRDIVTASIERNVGARFVDFSRMLLETDRVHATRRSHELAEAIEVYGQAGRPVHLATAAVEVLRAASAAWAAPDAPSSDAGGRALARYLSVRLRTDDALGDP